MAANAERRGLRLHGTRGMVAIISGHTGRSGGKMMQHRPPFKRSVCCWQLERTSVGLIDWYFTLSARFAEEPFEERGSQERLYTDSHTQTLEAYPGVIENLRDAS